MKIIFISHPIGGDVMLNLSRIMDIVREINKTMPDIVPLAPYFADVLAMNDNDPEERARGLKNGLSVIESGMVDELWLYGNRISEGMQMEIDAAKKKGIPVVGKSKWARIKMYYREQAQG